MLLLIMLGLSIFMGYEYYHDFYTRKQVRVSSSETTVYVNKVVTDALSLMYGSYDTEYFVCLDGYEKDGNLYVTGMRSSEIRFANKTTVHSYCCDKRAIADLHNHPGGSCTMSKPDIYGFGWCEIDYRVIHCGKNNFAFYSPDNLNERLKIMIV
jgi:hypothetical protein